MCAASGDPRVSIGREVIITMSGGGFMFYADDACSLVVDSFPGCRMI